jgi:hypothetical protein
MVHHFFMLVRRGNHYQETGSVYPFEQIVRALPIRETITPIFEVTSFTFP